MPSLFTILVLVLAGGGILYEGNKMIALDKNNPTFTKSSSHTENQDRAKNQPYGETIAPSERPPPRQAVLSVRETVLSNTTNDPRSMPPAAISVVPEEPQKPYKPIPSKPFYFPDPNYGTRW